MTKLIFGEIDIFWQGYCYKKKWLTLIIVLVSIWFSVLSSYGVVWQQEIENGTIINLKSVKP